MNLNFWGTMKDWKHEFIQANGIKFHYVTEGEGPLLLLLHGFPEFWYAWRNQIDAFSKNFKVVALDLRGYGQTERPEKVEDYRPDILAEDIKCVIQALGYEKADIVGHDWGGGIAWRVALIHPEVVNRLVVLNCPHPYKFAKALTSNLQQMMKSWYIYFVQIPGLPEYLFQKYSKKLIPQILKGSSRHGVFTKEDIHTYTEAMEQPGAFKAALNYYRAARMRPPHEKNQPPPHRQVKAPTLIIWGEKDKALGKELTYNMDKLFTAPFTLHYLPECSHWTQEDEPETVNRLILDFLI